MHSAQPSMRKATSEIKVLDSSEDKENSSAEVNKSINNDNIQLLDN